MRKYIDTPKIEYVITHLKLRCDFQDELQNRFIFLKEEDITEIAPNSVIFLLSNQCRNLETRIGEIPILYPIRSCSKHYSIENGSLIFNHDILQEIFCFQTLYYEREIKDKDKLGRIIPQATLNFQLDLVNIPVVDYLFEVLLEALQEFASIHNISFERKQFLKKATFLLSHDVDRVDTYSFYNTLNTFKMICKHPNKKSLKNMKNYTKQFFKGNKKENPLWDFSRMREIEKEFSLKSSYYFLNQGRLHQDAYYSLVNPAILKLINTIENDGNEIGIHLTIAANTDESVLRENLLKLNRVIKGNVLGARSHWLRFERDFTPDILANSKLKYDTSIGHYSLEGFRAGTCLPYKLFSFSENSILPVWEFPLIFMECMILDYQNISEDEAMKRLSRILQEVRKFNGLFTLLWHNGNFAKLEPFNRYSFYRALLTMIKDEGFRNYTGKELVLELEGKLNNVWN